jgi:hypothetical protein
MEGIFGKDNEMRGHLLEVEFIKLDTKTFDNLQDFFTKYKDLLSQLKACGVAKYKEAHANPKKEGYSKPFNDSSGSKGGKRIKWEKCTYYHK